MSHEAFFCGLAEKAALWWNNLHDKPTAAVPAKDLRTEPRWLAHERVGLYFLRDDGGMEQGEGNLVDRSESGVRLWSKVSVSNGQKFLIVDGLGNEGEAEAVWVQPESGGVLVGARVDWVGAVVSQPGEDGWARLDESPKPIDQLLAAFEDF